MHTVYWGMHGSQEHFEILKFENVVFGIFRINFLSEFINEISFTYSIQIIYTGFRQDCLRFPIDKHMLPPALGSPMNKVIKLKIN
jgi:hypothetical protein